MPEGSGEVPVVPKFPEEWALGKPDLVLEMPESMAVPALGNDLFMNFVLQGKIEKTRWVRAMEIKPGSPQVTHHANVILDRTASIRRTHPDDWQKGIPGMDIMVDSGDGFDPDSHFLFWKPDSTALVEPEGMPWRLDPGDDLVLNMHLKPTGKAETVRARIGLYFTDKAATVHPMLLQLENDAALDIPAGAAAFPVEDKLTLPVAVDVLGIYPHAHSLARRMEAWVTLPGGARRNLLLIEDWDIDRQSVYRLAEAMSLPAFSTIRMRYTYDNSSANVRNPETPPVRVRAGNRSADEMAHLWLQVLPHAAKAGGPDPRMALERAWMESQLHKTPQDTIAGYNLAALSLAEGRAAEAVPLFRQVLAAKPKDARTLTSLGSALELSGDGEGAAAQYRNALLVDPGYANAMYDLASLELRTGHAEEAERLFRALLRIHPDDAGADAGLAEIEVGAEHFDAAAELASRAVTLRNAAGDRRLLALARMGQGNAAAATSELEAWERLAPEDPEAHRALAQVYRQSERRADALREAEQVLRLVKDSAADWNDLGVLQAGGGDKTGARRSFLKALEIEPENAAAKGNLGKL